MISNRWIELRQENWNRLEAMVQRTEAGSLKTLSSDELRDLGLLYRQAAADLSATRADHSSRTLEGYLNQLVSRAHNYIYSGQRMSPATVWEFLAHGYPRIFRRLLPYTIAALILFLAGALLGRRRAEAAAGPCARKSSGRICRPSLRLPAPA
jgi:plasmid stabilization system protein ParE